MTAPRQSRYRVAIIGAGPAGSACALALARRGIEDVLLIDAAEHGQFRIGESIPPQANRLLSELGIMPAFLEERHAPCHGSCSYWGSDKRGYNDALMNPLGHGWHLDRLRFDRFLADQARQGGAELVGATRLAGSAAAPGGGFALQLQSGAAPPWRHSAIHADFVVDASGTRAVFARQRGSRKVASLALVALAMRFAPLAGAPLPTASSGLTHLEAVEHGWWYGAHLPDGSLLLSFNSDAATIKARRLQHAAQWLDCLAAAPNTAALASGMAPLAGGVQGFPAPSYCLDRLHGDDWLAIGDAAMACDPVTSQGIVKALADGMAAAGVIAAGTPASAFALSVTQQYQRYLALRSTYYCWERRWPGAPFWRQFHFGAPAE